MSREITREEKNMLKQMIDNGMIDLDSVKCIDMIKKEQVQKLHHQAVTYLEKEGRFQTYYKKDGKRRCLKAKTEKELYERLFDLYYTQQEKTFLDVWKEAFSQYDAIHQNKSTVLRLQQRFNKYFGAKASFLNKAVSSITTDELECFCNQLISSQNLTKGEWVNVRLILKTTFEHAMRKEYISKDPMRYMRIVSKLKPKQKKDAEHAVFNKDEQKQLVIFCTEKYQETSDTRWLAVVINLTLGLRVGELSALRWSDLKENRLYVHSMEDKTGAVVEHTKTYHDRYVIVPKATMELFAKIKKQGLYIFMYEGERMTNRQLNYKLEYYADHKEKLVKRSHALRRTYASNNYQMNLEELRIQMGHQNCKTTLENYMFNGDTVENTVAFFDNKADEIYQCIGVVSCSQSSENKKRRKAL